MLIIVEQSKAIDLRSKYIMSSSSGSNAVRLSSYIDSFTKDEIITLYRALTMAIAGYPDPKVYGEDEEVLRMAVCCSLVDVADTIGRK